MVSVLAGGVAAGGVVSVVSSEPEHADSASVTPAKLASQRFFMKHLNQEPILPQRPISTRRPGDIGDSFSGSAARIDDNLLHISKNREQLAGQGLARL
jgi:hypothetical protein